MRDGAATAGIVLAAGAGTRFGQPKVLAAQGEWLRSAVHALSGGGCGPVFVVLGAAVVDVPPPGRPVVAAGWADGMSSSLRAGLDAADGTAAEAVVLHLVDVPDVGPDVVRRVVAAWHADPAGLARAQYRGVPGHPVVIARRHWAALRETLCGDRGARDFLRARPVLAVECGDLATGVDVDTPRPG